LFVYLAVPRILFDGWTGDDYNALFSSEDHIEDCITAIFKFVKVDFLCLSVHNVQNFKD